MENLKLKKAQRLFNRAANLWINANNSGQNIDEKKREKTMDRAEALVKEVYPNIEIDYPGLYPAFKLDGFNYYSLEEVERWGRVNA